MSSQTHAANTVPARNPRRRGRKDIEDTGSLRLQPVRKRHKTSENGSASVSLDSDLTNGHAVAPISDSIPVRQRVVSGDDSRLDLLVKNENFTIGQLSALPKELRASKEGEHHSFLPVFLID